MNGTMRPELTLTEEGGDLAFACADEFASRYGVDLPAHDTTYRR